MIEIFNVNVINKGDMQATCSVKFKPWKFTLHQIPIFQKGVNRWVGLPTKKYETVLGEIKYQDIMEWDDESTKKRFRDQIILAVDDYIEKNNGLHGEPLVSENNDFPF